MWVVRMMARMTPSSRPTKLWVAFFDGLFITLLGIEKSEARMRRRGSPVRKNQENRLTGVQVRGQERGKLSEIRRQSRQLKTTYNHLCNGKVKGVCAKQSCSLRTGIPGDSWDRAEARQVPDKLKEARITTCYYDLYDEVTEISLALGKMPPEIELDGSELDGSLKKF
ncbi:hypothetical protein DdX_10622 [Ditylenchus destructor]|uniref:Uncharacterized protein n=1 Tax=Ditylenchus destructor TaxID=166010 RepID=A0AAD4N3R6_9BILA|nr:hypothetical protein DdX_10622 [Ditylenchus destructor]